MKQHITIEQWEELNKDQKCKLYDYFLGDSIDFLVSRDERQLKTQLSIGQMIEFLEENNSIDLIRKSPIGNEWIINHPTTFGVEYIDKELCNCLWEAVKEVLGEL